jgi:spore coat polysaccharide biosynthesis predicted glycosyltransferase SpsG
MKNVVFCTEASEKIGFGHFIECLSIATKLSDNKNEISFLINDNESAIRFLNDLDLLYNIYTDFSEIDSFLKKNNFLTCVTNLRSIQLDLMKTIKKQGIKSIVIDELGNKPIIADALINGAAVEGWHKYCYPDKKPKTYFGPMYMILGERFLKYHDKEKETTGTFLVSMGGVDRSGTTLKLIKTLKIFKNSKKKVIIGPGFYHEGELNRIKVELDESFDLVYDIKDLSNLIYESDIIFSAGGNTLHEAACVGTPAIILWEDKHEKEQAEWFAKKGAAINLGSGVIAKEEEVMRSIDNMLSDSIRWKKMSDKGKELIDGRGLERIGKIVKQLQG